METHQRLTEGFRQRLSLFSFFHLGSDAKIEIEQDSQGLKVSVAHSRVIPFEMRLPWAELEQLLDEPSRLEALMLDYLTRYRRS